LNIAAYDVESPESLLIELPEKRAQDILREFSNDYEKMACSLQVMNKRLVLLNPVSDVTFYLFIEICPAEKFCPVNLDQISSSAGAAARYLRDYRAEGARGRQLLANKLKNKLKSTAAVTGSKFYLIITNECLLF